MPELAQAPALPLPPALAPPLAPARAGAQARARTRGRAPRSRCAPLLLAATALTAADAGAAALPDGYLRGLRAAGIAEGAASAVVVPLDGRGLEAALNRDVPRNPASTMKLLTTYAALRTLGPAFAWHTDIALLGQRDGDVVLGDLAVRGGGDPALVVEQLWLLVQKVRGLGIREIRGDLVLDRSAFQLPPHDSGAFDGDALRSYNVGPDALLLNYKSVVYGFVPDPAANTVRLTILPPLAGSKAPATVSASAGACGDWRGKLRADFSRPFAPVFRGSFPLACGERNWSLSPIEPTAYFGAVFRALWESSGGSWSGKPREGVAPEGTPLLAVHVSKPLSEVVRDINKYSNNVMAQHVYLTFGAERLGWPASFARSETAMRGWLAEAGLALPGLVLENGAGLSRIERISAGGLAALLVDAYRSPVMAELMASLPVAGVDGTATRRKGASGVAHLKTGLLNDVRAIAGYVLADSGRRYVVVAIVNDARAGGAQAAHDALLEWVRREG
ncbi:MAG: D-alanyl-D-alanine carboxypeptidase [Steroidobacteraceae bacterium]